MVATPRPDSSAFPIATIEVRTATSYRLHVGPGAAVRLTPWLEQEHLAARYALVTDTRVAELHARPVAGRMIDAGLAVTTVMFPAGEASKTRATKETIEDALLDAGCGRDTAIVALGGGVTTDMAGFVAATYQRGIPYVQVPTTLLAMVDASVGGKTAVDHPRGKNLIGAFHQPSAVFIDTDFLATLPDRELRCGLAEVVKAAVVRDAGLFLSLQAGAAGLLAREAAPLAGAIARACEIKAEVVAADEKEGDLRKILNLGHTIGHAIEALSGYAMPHGEAVSIGMVAETRLAARLGVLAQTDAAAIEALLASLGLPVRLPADHAGMTPWAILEAARRDKKSREGRIAYVLPSRIGEMSRGPAGYGIPLEDVLAAEILTGMQESAPPK